MAIVSGCDYLDGLNGMGLKSAYGLFQRFKKSDKVRPRAHLFYLCRPRGQVIQHIRMSGKIKVASKLLRFLTSSEGYV
jgi:5'-3' exonuclease